MTVAGVVIGKCGNAQGKREHDGRAYYFKGLHLCLQLVRGGRLKSHEKGNLPGLTVAHDSCLVILLQGFLHFDKKEGLT